MIVPPMWGCLGLCASRDFGALLFLFTCNTATSQLRARPCAGKMAQATVRPAKVRRAPYKDFLQPALHRRFSSAALIVLGVAYVEALLLSSWSSCELTTASPCSWHRC